MVTETTLQEQISKPRTVTAVQTLATSDFETAYREAALGYHNMLASMAANAKTLQPRLRAAALNQNIDSTSEQTVDLELYLLQLADRGYVEDKESAAWAAFRQFIRRFDYENYSSIRDIRGSFTEWRSQHNVSQTTSSVVYHVTRILEEIMANNQATLSNVTTEPDQYFQFKRNDGFLCFIDHRNWLSARLGLCPGANDDDVAEILSNTVQELLVEEASEQFDKYSDQIADRLFNANGNGLTDFERIGLNFLQGIIRSSLEEFVENWWLERWCREECDACSSALGVAAIWDGCSFEGIAAVGSEFEFNEGIDFIFDYNLDGVVDEQRQRFDAQYPAGAISNNGPFNVRVDVTCDGGREFPWPGGSNGRALILASGYHRYPERPCPPLRYNRASITDQIRGCASLPILQLTDGNIQVGLPLGEALARAAEVTSVLNSMSNSPYQEVYN